MKPILPKRCNRQKYSERIHKYAVALVREAVEKCNRIKWETTQRVRLIMTRKPKRFETRNQIVDSIQKYKDKIVSLHAEADKLEVEANAIFKADQSELFEDAKYKIEHCKRLRKRALNIADKKIPALIHTLSAFDTEIMPSIIQDRAVVMEEK